MFAITATGHNITTGTVAVPARVTDGGFSIEPACVSEVWTCECGESMSTHYGAVQHLTKLILRNAAAVTL